MWTSVPATLRTSGAGRKSNCLAGMLSASWITPLRASSHDSRASSSSVFMRLSYLHVEGQRAGVDALCRRDVRFVHDGRDAGRPVARLEDVRALHGDRALVRV